MFEFQTAMSELTGLPVSNAGALRGPLRRSPRPRYLAIGATGRQQARRLARRPPAQPRDARDLRAPATAPRWSRSALEGGVTDAAALAAAVDDETAAVFLQQPELPRRGRGRRGAGRGGEGARRAASSSPVDPIDARRSCGRPASAAPTSRSARASRSATGSTTAARRSASSARPRSTSAACRAGSPARRPTSTAAAASCSRCRPASSTSAARRRPTTSAPPRR